MGLMEEKKGYWFLYYGEIRYVWLTDDEKLDWISKNWSVTLIPIQGEIAAREHADPAANRWKGERYDRK